MLLCNLFNMLSILVLLAYLCNYYYGGPSQRDFSNTSGFPFANHRYAPIVHGGSMKCKPNGLCHNIIYILPDHIILKLPIYLENTRGVVG